jgi:hypothetical protein
MQQTDVLVGTMWLVSRLSVNFSLLLGDVNCSGLYTTRLFFSHLILVYLMLPNIDITWSVEGGLDKEENAPQYFLPENSFFGY